METLRSRIVQYLHELGTKPKKSLGQNFLICETAYEKILNAIKQAQPQVIVEIGPGLGFVAEKLLEAKSLGQNSLVYIGVELDMKLFNFLKKRFSDSSCFRFIHEDFLTFEFQELENIMLLGNIPYHLSGPILYKVCANSKKLKSACLMIQKELGDRVLATAGSRAFGRLTVLCQTFFKIRREFFVPRACFYPKPKVDSVILSFEPVENPPIGADLVQKVTHLCFSQKRKTIHNNLKSHTRETNSEIVKRLAQHVQEFFASHKLLSSRAEEIQINTWRELFVYLSNHSSE